MDKWENDEPLNLKLPEVEGMGRLIGTYLCRWGTLKCSLHSCHNGRLLRVLPQDSDLYKVQNFKRMILRD